MEKHIRAEKVNPKIVRVVVKTESEELLKKESRGAIYIRSIGGDKSEKTLQ